MALMLKKEVAVAETDHLLNHSNSKVFLTPLNKTFAEAKYSLDMKFLAHNQKCHKYHVSIEMTKKS